MKIIKSLFIGVLMIFITTGCNITSFKKVNKMTYFEKAQVIKQKIERGDLLIGLLQTEDIDLMLNLYAKSGESGNPAGWYELGMSYYLGVGVEQNAKKALSYFRLAGESGYGIDAWIKYLRVAYFANVESIPAEKIINLVEKLKEEDPSGEVYLLKGYMLYRGYAYTENLKSSLNAHYESAKKGNANAMFELCVYFAQGIGVKEDIKKSLDWCVKAAEKENIRAIYNLATYYAAGYEHISKNTDKAIEYYTKAANLGHGKAAAQLSAMYTIGDEVDKNEELAKKFYELAFELDFQVDIFFEDLGLDEIKIED
ncbi:sel1 repeat family protein [Aquimarina sp. MMG015]|uniref:tetratricopeptide repeat protein n=1 Tax=unclassified Aquimarina TaxID=2627091 RepID=UPI000EDC4B79|nr:tetratricopeptide repeat protein [Aquimarina sp. AD1]MBQ4802654.1 sel1 repeat family protein [Aquimarina sp. MMG015]RKN19376.1 sel1 repeat family protein [Aquimarina sp. AD1]